MVEVVFDREGWRIWICRGGFVGRAFYIEEIGGNCVSKYIGRSCSMCKKIKWFLFGCSWDG